MAKFLQPMPWVVASLCSMATLLYAQDNSYQYNNRSTGRAVFTNQINTVPKHEQNVVVHESRVSSKTSMPPNGRTNAAHAGDAVPQQIVLYIGEHCGKACQFAERFLKIMAVPMETRSIDDPQIWQEVLQLVGNPLGVNLPVIRRGDRYISGFNSYLTRQFLTESSH